MVSKSIVLLSLLGAYVGNAICMLLKSIIYLSDTIILPFLHLLNVIKFCIYLSDPCSVSIHLTLQRRQVGASPRCCTPTA